MHVGLLPRLGDLESLALRLLFPLLCHRSMTHTVSSPRSEAIE